MYASGTLASPLREAIVTMATQVSPMLAASDGNAGTAPHQTDAPRCPCRSVRSYVARRKDPGVEWRGSLVERSRVRIPKQRGSFSYEKTSTLSDHHQLALRGSGRSRPCLPPVEV